MGAAIVAGIEAGWVAPVINKEYNLEQAALVHHDIIHSNGAKGKLVLKVGNEDWWKQTMNTACYKFDMNVQLDHETGSKEWLF